MSVVTRKKFTLSPKETRRGYRNYKNALRRDFTTLWEPYWRIIKIRLPKKKGEISFTQLLERGRSNE